MLGQVCDGAVWSALRHGPVVLALLRSCALE